LGIKNQMFLQFQESDNSWSKIEVIENFFHQKKIIDNYSINEKNNINGSKIGENYLRVNNRLYLKLKLIGKGGTSKVYKVLSEDKVVYALKKSRLQNLMIENFHNCINEISILKSLKGKSGIIDLQDADISIKNAQMLIILELGDCDLDYIIRKNSKVFRKNSFVKFIWKSMLESVQTIHGERIVHGDLKPANFLIVNNSLKIIDFGIARGIQKDTTNITRNIQIGTINYMSPEAISDTSENFGKKKKFKLSRSADIWSLGCILFQIIYGQTPFFHLTIGKKIQAITSKHSYLSFLPLDIPHVIDVLKNCLKKDPESRPSIPELLNHPFLSTNDTLFTFVKGENMKKYSIK
jgi:serine/threonine-protein kinase TTK/MPS1